MEKYWAIKGLLEGWFGGSILILKFAKIQSSINYKLCDDMQNNTISFVEELIDNNTRDWNKEVVLNNFSIGDAN